MIEKVTEFQVRKALLDAGVKFDSHIVNVVMGLINLHNLDLKQAYNRAICEAAQVNEAKDEDDSSQIVPESGSYVPSLWGEGTNGANARKFVDHQYHGESFHQDN